MSDEKDALKKEIVNILKKRWEQSKEPFLLSKIPSMVNDVSYKDALAGQSLKNFINETSGEDSYRIVEDPKHKARIGIVPFGEAYANPETTNNKTTKITLNNKDILVDFLKLLSSLPDEDLDSIVIPARILVKLVSQ